MRPQSGCSPDTLVNREAQQNVGAVLGEPSGDLMPISTVPRL